MDTKIKNTQINTSIDHSQYHVKLCYYFNCNIILITKNNSRIKYITKIQFTNSVGELTVKLSTNYTTIKKSFQFI